MSIYDPPSDPECCAHECRECDQPLTKELDGEWVCHNPQCTRSPFFKPPKRAYCVDCGVNDFVDDDWNFLGYDDDTELYRCPKCEAQQVEV